MQEFEEAGPYASEIASQLAYQDIGPSKGLQASTQIEDCRTPWCQPNP
jgi:hypothetical protein